MPFADPEARRAYNRRWMRNQRGRKAARELGTDPAAVVARWSAKELRIPSGPRAGDRFVLDEWEVDFLRLALADGVREAVLSVARKNGKSALIAVLLLAFLVRPAEPAELARARHVHHRQAGRRASGPGRRDRGGLRPRGRGRVPVAGSGVGLRAQGRAGGHPRGGPGDGSRGRGRSRCGGRTGALSRRRTGRWSRPCCRPFRAETDA